MKREFLQLEGITRTERHVAVDKVKESILSGGGFITDFIAFSNKSVCIKFEVSFGSLEKLAKRVFETSVLTSKSIQELESKIVDVQIGNPDKEIACTLNLMFVHDEPDLRREAPPIPG